MIVLVSTLSINVSAASVLATRALREKGLVLCCHIYAPEVMTHNNNLMFLFPIWYKSNRILSALQLSFLLLQSEAIC